MSLTNIRLLPKTLFSVLAVTLSFYATPGAAEDAWYGRVTGGFGSLDDSSVQSPFGGSSNASFDTGFRAGGSIGYNFGGWRLEGEAMYRTNDIDSLALAGAPTGTRGGDFSSLGIGINAFKDFNLTGYDSAQAYIGAGLVMLEEIDMDFETSTGEISYSDSDSGYQIMLGARYRLDNPWNLFAEFRYFDAGTVKLDGEDGASGVVEADYATISIMFGVGYTFR